MTPSHFERGAATAGLLAALVIGCSREPERAAPSDTGAAPPRPSIPSASAQASAARPDPNAGSAVADLDPIPEQERRSIPGLIAFVSERDKNPEVYLVRPSGEELRRLTQSPAADFPVAPDREGKALLLVSAEEDHERKLHLEQLVVQPLAGGPGTPIGPRGGRDRNASFSPDGRWIVFESDSESFSDIYRMNRDGSGLRRLTQNKEGNFEPALSPDGTQIAFVSSRDGDPEIYRMRTDGKRQQRLTAFHREDWAPRWSPDGKRIAFLSDREGHTRIFIMNADGTKLSALTSPAANEGGLPPSGNAGAPKGEGERASELEQAWSPDGDRIAYITRAMGKKARVWVARVATGECKPLTGGAYGDESPAWSPDGRYLVFVSDRAGDLDLYLMRADGTGQTRLTHAKGVDWLPRWISTGPRARVRD